MRHDCRHESDIQLCKCALVQLCQHVLKMHADATRHIVAGELYARSQAMQAKVHARSYRQKFS